MTATRFNRGQRVRLADGSIGSVIRAVVPEPGDTQPSYLLHKWELTDTTIARADELSDKVVTIDEAAHVVYYRGRPGGMDGGGFVHALLRTIETADATNTEKLRLAFPGYVAAMKDWYLEEVIARLSEDD